MLKRLSEKLKGHSIIEHCFDEGEILRAERENVSEIDATTVLGGGSKNQNYKKVSSCEDIFQNF